MAPLFSIDVDVDRDLIRIWLSGFFKPEDLPAFVASRDEAHRRLYCGPNEHLTLVDMREMAIQAQNVVAGFSDMLTNKAMESRRLAFVTGKTLARMQIERAAKKRNAAFFADIHEAEAWLFEPQVAAA